MTAAESFLAEAEAALEGSDLVGAGICLGWVESLLCNVPNEHPDWARYHAVAYRAWNAGRAMREERAE